MPSQLRTHLNEAVAYIQSQTATTFRPAIGLVLGTGLGQLAEEMEVEVALPYDQIPHFPVSTVESHSGRLLLGQLGGKQVVAMQGRFHYYEGYTMQQITFPIRVMKALGVETLLVSNAAGGLQAHIKKGSLLFIRDHINLQPSNPLIGPNDETLGVRFPDMSQVYDQQLLDLATSIAQQNGFDFHTGVYVSVPGPNLETPAEYRYLHLIGGDAVGMSTVPEVIVAVHSGLRVFAVSVITDEGYPIEHIQPVSIEEVIAVANATQPKLSLLMKSLIEQL